MAGLAAAAERRVPVKKENKEKNSSVKLKAFRLTSGCLIKRVANFSLKCLQYDDSSDDDENNVAQYTYNDIRVVLSDASISLFRFRYHIDIDT